MPAKKKIESPNPVVPTSEKKTKAAKHAAKKTVVAKSVRDLVGISEPRRAVRRKADAHDADVEGPAGGAHGELVILTGMSGAGKASALKAFEDMGYYSVDNLPLELIPRFADLVRQSAEIERAALVIDVRN